MGEWVSVVGWVVYNVHFGSRIHESTGWPNWIRRLTSDQKIGGSSPSSVIFLFAFCFLLFAFLLFVAPFVFFCFVFRFTFSFFAFCRRKEFLSFVLSFGFVDFSRGVFHSFYLLLMSLSAVHCCALTVNVPSTVFQF